MMLAFSPARFDLNETDTNEYHVDLEWKLTYVGSATS